MKIKSLINQIKLLMDKITPHNEYKYSFSFALLLSYLNINVGSEAPFIAHYSFGVFILSLIVLYSFTKVICYLSSIILLKFYKIDEKYIKLKKVISYFEKMSTLIIVIELITGYVFLLMIIFLSIYILKYIHYPPGL